MIVRAATPDDLPAVAAFDPFGGDRAAEVAEGRCLVAAAEEGVRGYVSWQPRGFVGNPLVTYLCVHEDARRRGVARSLLGAARARIGPVKTFVSTEVGNGAMRALLVGMGWVEAGTVANANADGEGEVFFLCEGAPPST